MKILIPDHLSKDQVSKITSTLATAEIINSSDLENNPKLISQVEIAYDGLNKDQWEQATSLKWYQSSSAGIEGLLKGPAKEHPAIITNAHIHAASMSEHLFGLMIMLAHRINTAYEYQKDHNWDRDEVGKGFEVLNGKTLGIIGLGSIGNRIAELGIAFNMKVLGLKKHPDQRNYQVVGPNQLNYLLESSDFVVLCLPRTKETIHMIAAKELAKMKPSAYIFNLGRGSAIDSQALVEAIMGGQIKGAGLDVADPEPLPADSPLWDLPNVIITPHTSSDTKTYGDDALEVFLSNLKHYQAGEPLDNVVDKARGY